MPNADRVESYQRRVEHDHKDEIIEGVCVGVEETSERCFKTRRSKVASCGCASSRHSAGVGLSRIGSVSATEPASLVGDSTSFVAPSTNLAATEERRSVEGRGIGSFVATGATLWKVDGIV